MKRIVACCVVLVLFASGCLKDKGENTCTFDECAFLVPATEVQDVEEYLTANSITATKHCSGMYYTILDPGAGIAPQICNSVGVKYIGKLTDGQTFDESTDPVIFNLGTLIGGWQLGITLIKPGGKIRLFIPPSLGYGSQATGSVPANSILVFDIDLVAVY